ncbi:hypothetical protein Hjap01_03811 [Haloarcula japonica]
MPALLGVGAVVIENNTLVVGALLHGHVSKTLGDTPDSIPVGCVPNRCQSVWVAGRHQR